MVLVLLASIFAAALAASTHNFCTLKIFHYIQRGLHRRVIRLGFLTEECCSNSFRTISMLVKMILSTGNNFLLIPTL